MPRGDNPRSRANLTKLTTEEARKRGRAGAKRSAEVRRELKTFIELDKEHTTSEERQKMLDMLKKRAEQGNLRAFELYANYMGLKPAEKVEVTTIDDEAVQGLKDAIKSRRADSGEAE